MAVHRYRGRNGVRRRATDGDSSAPQGSAASTTEQVHEILRAADRQASEMRREVETWARTRVRTIEDEALRYLDEAKARSDALVAERLDPVIALGAIVEEHAERVIALLEETDWIKVELRDLIREMREGLHDDVTPQVEPRAPDAAAPGALAERDRPAPAPDQLDDADDSSGGYDEEGVRLLALQMAMNGRTRAEVEHRIVDDYDILEPHGILDDVFGIGTTGSHRISWNDHKPG